MKSLTEYEYVYDPLASMSVGNNMNLIQFYPNIAVQLTHEKDYGWTFEQKENKEWVRLRKLDELELEFVKDQVRDMKILAPMELKYPIKKEIDNGVKKVNLLMTENKQKNQINIKITGDVNYPNETKEKAINYEFSGLNYKNIAQKYFELKANEYEKLLNATAKTPTPWLSVFKESIQQIPQSLVTKKRPKIS